MSGIVVSEPTHKRVVAFIDGQNLFFAAREVFGYDYFNVRPIHLAHEVCKQRAAEG